MYLVPIVLLCPTAGEMLQMLNQRGWLLLLGVEGSGQARAAGRPELHPGVVIPR